jgi:hypothetical protein
MVERGTPDELNRLPVIFGYAADDFSEIVLALFA